MRDPLKILPSALFAGALSFMVVSAQAAPAEDMPMGQTPGEETILLPEDEPIAGDELFGAKGGYWHPYISIGGEYTDNLFNVAGDTTSSFVGSIAPGIWLSLPRTKEIPIEIEPHNTSPGGLEWLIKDYEGTDRYQAYALAGLDYKMYSEDSDLNDTDARLEGLFRYNMRGGLSLQVLDSFNYAQDEFGVGSATNENLRRYTSNVIMGTADYQITEKVRAKVNLSNYILDYDEEVNDIFDRTDNAFDVYGYYVYSPKTSLFLQYRFVDVGYDSEEAKDNTQHYGYGGITWDTTDKLALGFKAGYQEREYDESSVSDAYDWSGFAFYLKSLYRWTEKTEFNFDVYQRSEESDSGDAIDKVALGAVFQYNQELTEKLSVTLSARYEDYDYTQIDFSDRDDTRYYIRPSLQYLFREWMMVELAYSFDTRDSTNETYDYDTNTVMLNVNFAM